jgi:cytochrome c oxidase assembly protein subunit 15
MSPTTPHNPWLNRFAGLTAAATLVLICIGGLVTSKGAGMAVPDWPNTYGYNLFLFPVSQWVGGILYEHTHRLVAAGVGLLTTALALWLWARETRGAARWTGLGLMLLAVALLGARQMPVYLVLAALGLVAIPLGLWRFARAKSGLRWLGLAAFGSVILQGVLGGLRVAWLKDEIGVFHGMLAQAFLVLLVVIALLTSAWWRESAAGWRDARALRWLVLGTTVAVFLQLGLGASMRHRHAGLAVPDFPLAQGRLWPATDPDSIQRYNLQRVEVHAAQEITAFDVTLHMLHRVGACVVTALAIACFVRTRRRLPAGHPVRRGAAFWLALVAVQFTLGAITVWTNKAADIATAHVAVGSLVLATGGLLCVLAFRPAARNHLSEAAHAAQRHRPVGLAAAN